MKNIQEKCKRYIEDNFSCCEESSKEELDYLEHSTAKYKGQTIYSLHIPKMFTLEAKAVLEHGAETMYGILYKVMREYLANPQYRKLFGFSKELESMICNTPHYENILPICRLDIFLNEEDYGYKFCEFNGDGTSSMNEDRELNIAFQKTALYNYLTKEYKLEPFELFDSWAKECKKIYESTGKKAKESCIAVVDFLEKGCSIFEFEEFCRAFERVGFRAKVCEIRDLSYNGEYLYDKEGDVIDVIYRRAVTSDIMAHKNEVSDFLQCVSDKKVCLIGDFCTHIMHDKILFQLLRHEHTKSILTEEENHFVDKHIPETIRLSGDIIKSRNVEKDKEHWIIKPEDSYGAKGVYAGIHYSKEEWSKLLKKYQDKDYLLQEFVIPYQTYNIDFHPQKEHVLKKYSNLTGLYVYNGKLAGVYSRQSVKEIISTEHDENDIASLVISPHI
ncbi:MAG: glutathionylspermidine synthase family protein [Lachnospiraceae bacterium]|nr:glutathionylspermidine synthase family protein [Lachnospiraceae bacterium]